MFSNASAQEPLKVTKIFLTRFTSHTDEPFPKLMFLLGHGKSDKEIRELMNQPIAGEFTKI